MAGDGIIVPSQRDAMTIDLKTLAQNALATIISRQPNAVAEIVANSNTVNGIKDSRTLDANLDNNGEIGAITSTIRCNADDLGVLTRGQTITVGGVSVFVMRYKIDPCGAVATIEYSEQKPI